jgi:hypothetical protein
MAGVPEPAYQQFWTSVENEHKDLISNYPYAAPSIKQLFQVLCDIEDLAGYTSLSVGLSEEWAAITSLADENRENYCKVLRGETLFSALYGCPEG